jgi:hypothetical protein
MSIVLLEGRRGAQQRLDCSFENEGDPLMADARYSNWTDAHGGPTLDDLITGVWEGLAVRETVRCPACGGTMASHSMALADTGSAAAAASAAARLDAGDAAACMDCGARLS